MSSYGNYHCCNYESDRPIKSQIGTCHDSSAVLTCAELWLDRIFFFNVRVTCVLQQLGHKLINPSWNGSLCPFGVSWSYGFPNSSISAAISHAAMWGKAGVGCLNFDVHNWRCQRTGTYQNTRKLDLHVHSCAMRSCASCVILRIAMCGVVWEFNYFYKLYVTCNFLDDGKVIVMLVWILFFLYHIYIYIKWTVFVNVTTKSAQHAHARMIAIIVEKSPNSSHMYDHGFMDNTNRQAVKNWLDSQTRDASLTSWRQPFWLQNGCLHDVRDASLVCESSQFLTAWRLVLSMKPLSYTWLEFGLFSTIIYIYIYISMHVGPDWC